MEDPEWLEPDELRAWVTVSALLETLPGAIDAQLKRDSGLNLFEYTVLAMLSEEPSATLQMSDLAEMAFGSLSRLSHAITRLERRGLVERRSGDGGRRHTIVTLTREGHRVIADTSPAHVAHVRSLLIDPLSPGELAQLRDLLARIIARADPELHDRLPDLLESIVDRN